MNELYVTHIGKVKPKSIFKKPGQALWDMNLAPIEICRDTVPAQFKINPLSMTPKTISSHITDISKESRNMTKEMVKGAPLE